MEGMEVECLGSLMDYGLRCTPALPVRQGWIFKQRWKFSSLIGWVVPLLGLYEDEWLANQSREKAKRRTKGSLRHQRSKIQIANWLLRLRRHWWVTRWLFQLVRLKNTSTFRNTLRQNVKYSLPAHMMAEYLLRSSIGNHLEIIACMAGQVTP